MLKKLSSALLLGCALVGAVISAANLSAQANDSVDKAAPDRANGVCLARQIEHRDGAAVEATNKLFFILAHPRSLPGLKARGFSETDCATAALATYRQRTEYKERICDLAASGNDAVQSQLEAVLGEAPAVLCANAELVVGAWKRERRVGQ